MSMRALAFNPATDRWAIRPGEYARTAGAPRVVDYLTDGVVAHVH